LPYPPPGSSDVATTSDTTATSSGSTSSNSDNEAVVDHLEQVMGVMMQNPAMMEMMLARMPPHMRKPEVLRAMLASPEVRTRIAALANQTVGVVGGWVAWVAGWRAYPTLKAADSCLRRRQLREAAGADTTEK
jgi:hypothetical protein